MSETSLSITMSKVLKFKSVLYILYSTVPGVSEDFTYTGIK